MPTHHTIITLPSNPRSRRRRPPSPAKPPPKPENAPIPSVTRHYPIPTIHPAPSALQNPSIGTHTSPFPSSLPSMHTNPTLKTTHSSQDDLTEETWGPVTTSEPLKPAHKKHKHKHKQNKNKNGDKDSTRHLKMCPTNGYQPRKGAAEGEGTKLLSAVSGSTEFVTGYKVERLVGGGERRTWVTWTRVVTVVEERVVDGAGVVREERADEEDGSEEESGGGEESTDEEESKGGNGKKKGKKGEGVLEVDESSDEEYFDEERCEWRSKEELKGKKGKDVVEESKKKEKQ